MAFYYQVVAQRGDGLKRWWHGSSVKLENIDQCPRCRGTDKTRETSCGYGVDMFRCDRCDVEWWS